MNTWICKECGQDSAQESQNCEICGIQKESEATSEKISHDYFEIDGVMISKSTGLKWTRKEFDSRRKKGLL